MVIHSKKSIDIPNIKLYNNIRYGDFLYRQNRESLYRDPDGIYNDLRI